MGCLSLVGEVVEAGHAHHAWVGVCGEAAADPVAAAALVGLGVDELSSTPAAVPAVKEALRRARLEDLREAVAAGRGAGDADEARRLVAACLR